MYNENGADLAGSDKELVSFLVFKTNWEARDVSGGFDSHTIPPIFFAFLQNIYAYWRFPISKNPSITTCNSPSVTVRKSNCTASFLIRTMIGVASSRNFLANASLVNV